ncbi:restriction endonuclease subunit S [Bilifractor porci]|uniref:Type I restriction modification DNA specificity domain-containing protein n=1 Tax=Bilifractor porci TaxID=2606636 RepID=A0A7X2P7N3_9FIRM|nr:restriction endonuclease subunit S [Bilifractor porci]MST81752.1 hypothetical protein [Bilifractor porci]
MARYKLEDIFDLQMGKTPSRNNPEYWDSCDNKWISIGDLTQAGKYVTDTKEYISDLAVEESGIKLIPANTVVMSFKLSIGKTAITSGEMYSNEAIMAFHDKHVVDLIPEYIYYMFKYKNWDEGTNKAVMGKTLNKATLSKVEIEVCPFEKQKEIVELLDKVSAILEERNDELQKLDDLIKARFVEMFGDPITNPMGWKKEETNKHIDLLSGYPFKSEQYVEDGINICGGLTIMPQRIEWDNCVHWPSLEGYEEYLLNEGDIVMALDRPWITEGFKVARIDANHLPALLIQRTARIRAIDIDQDYLYYCFINGGFDKHSNVTGSLVPHISAKDIRSFEIMIPPVELQKEFSLFMKQVDKSKVAVQSALDKAQLLFDSLMQQYFG